MGVVEVMALSGEALCTIPKGGEALGIHIISVIRSMNITFSIKC